MGRIWRNKGPDRRLSHEASSETSKHSHGKDTRPKGMSIEKKRQEETSSHKRLIIGIGRKLEPGRRRIASSSSTSSTSDSSTSEEDGRRRKESRHKPKRNSGAHKMDALPDFAKRPETRATRAPVSMQVDSEVHSGRRSKWDKVAGAMREMMESQHKKVKTQRRQRCRNSLPLQ